MSLCHPYELAVIKRLKCYGCNEFYMCRISKASLKMCATNTRDMFAQCTGQKLYNCEFPLTH